MLIRQTLLYVPAQVVGPLVQLVAMVVWTHFLSPADLGILALIVATQELIYSATLFWFSLATVRYYDHEDHVAARLPFLNSESAAILAASLAASLCVLILPLAVGGTWSLPLVGATMLYTVLRGLVAHLCDRARAEHDTLTYSLLQICWPVVGFIAGLACVVLFDATVTWVLVGYVVAHVIALAIAAARLEFGFTVAAADRGVIRQALRYGLPLVAGSILVWIAQNSLRFVVEWQHGVAAVGLITVGWGLGHRVSTFASMLVTAAAFPLAVKQSRETNLDDGQTQLQKNGILLLAALAPACIGLWLIGDAFVDLTVADPFQQVTKAVLPWAILAGGVRSLRLHFGEQVFLLRERTLITLTNDLIDAVLATAGTVIGLSYGGLEGAVIGGALGAIASTVVTLVWAVIAHAFTLPVWDSVKIAGATALMAVSVWLVPGSPTVVGLVIAIVIGAVVYGSGLALLYPDLRRAGRDMLANIKSLPTKSKKAVEQDP